MLPAIEVEQVSKHYGSLVALDNVSLAIVVGCFAALSWLTLWPLKTGYKLPN